MRVVEGWLLSVAILVITSIVRAENDSSDSEAPLATSDASERVILLPQPLAPPGAARTLPEQPSARLPPAPPPPRGARVFELLPPSANEAPSASEPIKDSISPKPRGSESVWYGYQTLIVDGIALALFAGGVASEEPAPAVLGGFGYVFGAPFVHFAHAHFGRGWGSFGLRLALPAAGAVVPSDDEPSPGLVIGVLSAVIIDGARSTELCVRRSKPEHALSISPLVSSSVKGFTLSGAF